MAALSGIRVLDLTRLLPGPYATRVLAELGAEVLKIEPPEGDTTRWMPPLAGEPAASGLFRELNSGKRSVVLDLKRAEAKLALRALAARADVLVEGFRPGVLTRLGLDPALLMAANPRLIYCAITGFGLSGPDALRAGHDIGYLARAGALELSGPSEAPVCLGIQVADIGSAQVAVAGILAALFERERSGRGQVVDVSLVESALPFAALAWGALHAGQAPRRAEQLLDGSRPCYGIYPTADGRFMAVGALEPKFWQMFVDAIGLPELSDAGLDSGPAGVAVRAKIEAKLRERTQREWTELFRQVDCCVEPIVSLSDAERDPHLSARGIHLPDGTVRSAIRLGPALPLAPAPALGADTAQVLSELELAPELLAALLQR